MTDSRRFSEAIAEGDGISVIAEVGDAGSARAAQEQGAEAVSVNRLSDDLRAATTLPIFWRGDEPLAAARDSGADACVLSLARGDAGDSLEALHNEARELGLDCVVEVGNAEELQLALERVDPEIFLFSAGADADGEGFGLALELLPDIPAGKLAIAEVPRSSRDQILELERAGVDAVIVATRDVAGLVGSAPPEV